LCSLQVRRTTNIANFTSKSKESQRIQGDKLPKK
jgi:hypothetical protein